MRALALAASQKVSVSPICSFIIPSPSPWSFWLEPVPGHPPPFATLQIEHGLPGSLAGFWPRLWFTSNWHHMSLSNTKVLAELKPTIKKLLNSLYHYHYSVDLCKTSNHFFSLQRYRRVWSPK